MLHVAVVGDVGLPVQGRGVEGVGSAIVLLKVGQEDLGTLVAIGQHLGIDVGRNAHARILVAAHVVRIGATQAEADVHAVALACFGGILQFEDRLLAVLGTTLVEPIELIDVVVHQAIHAAVDHLLAVVTRLRVILRLVGTLAVSVGQAGTMQIDLAESSLCSTLRSAPHVVSARATHGKQCLGLLEVSDNLVVGLAVGRTCDFEVIYAIGIGKRQGEGTEATGHRIEGIAAQEVGLALDTIARLLAHLHVVGATQHDVGAVHSLVAGSPDAVYAIRSRGILHTVPLVDELHIIFIIGGHALVGKQLDLRQIELAVGVVHVAIAVIDAYQRSIDLLLCVVEG